MRLPLEELRDKYIPITEFPEKYGISMITMKRLIESHKIRYAEFKAPGDRLRTLHANPEEVLSVLQKESNR